MAVSGRPSKELETETEQWKRKHKNLAKKEGLLNEMTQIIHKKDMVISQLQKTVTLKTGCLQSEDRRTKTEERRPKNEDFIKKKL